MTQAYNPLAPSSVGMEWAASMADVGALNDVTGLALRFRSMASEQVDQLLLPVGLVSLTAPMIVEVFAAGSEIGAAPTLTTYAVTAVPVLSAWNVAPTVANQAAIDGNVASASPSGIERSAEFSFGTGAFAAGLRVVRIEAVSHHWNGGNLYEVTPSGIKTPDHAQSASGGTWFDLALNLGELHTDAVTPVPSGTWTVWTQAQMQAFAAAGARRIQFRATPGGNHSLDQVVLKVWTIPENRVAYGVVLPGTSYTWLTVPVVTPTGGAWSKVNGTDYTVLLRRADLGASSLAAPSAYLRTLDATDGVGPPFANLYVYDDPMLDSNRVLTSLGTARTRKTRGLRLLRAGADLIESMPYAMVRSAEAHNGQNVEQDITMPTGSTGSYGALYAYLGEARNPTADVTFTVRRSSDNVQMGTATMTAAAIKALPLKAGYHEVRVGTGPMALVAGIKYYVQIITTAALANAWQVGAFKHIAAAAAALGFGGTTDVERGKEYNLVGSLVDATVDGGDVMVRVVQTPVGVGGFAAAHGSQALNPGSACGSTHCLVTAIDVAHLTWTGSTIGAAFVYYEVQRSDTVDTTWRTIAIITTIGTVAFDDYEARIGVVSSYRIRQIRNDGAASDWSAATPTITIAGEGAELLFTSNEQPSLNVAYPDAYDSDPARDYSFPEASEVTLRAMYGRDYQVAFRPTELRGVEFTRTLMVNALSTPTRRGPPVFEPLRALARATLSYVCVRDTEGNRYLATVIVPDGVVNMPKHRYFATVRVVEATATPTQPPNGPV